MINKKTWQSFNEDWSLKKIPLVVRCQYITSPVSKACSAFDICSICFLKENNLSIKNEPSCYHKYIPKIFPSCEKQGAQSQGRKDMCVYVCIQFNTKSKQCPILLISFSGWNEIWCQYYQNLIMNEYCYFILGKIMHSL